MYLGPNRSRSLILAWNELFIFIAVLSSVILGLQWEKIWIQKQNKNKYALKNKYYGCFGIQLLPHCDTRQGWRCLFSKMLNYLTPLKSGIITLNKKVWIHKRYSLNFLWLFLERNSLQGCKLSFNIISLKYCDRSELFEIVYCLNKSLLKRYLRIGCIWKSATKHTWNWWNSSLTHIQMEMSLQGFLMYQVSRRIDIFTWVSCRIFLTMFL